MKQLNRGLGVGVACAVIFLITVPNSYATATLLNTTAPLHTTTLTQRTAATQNTAKQVSAYEPLEVWLQRERDISLRKIEEAISPAGAASGVVIASPSREYPDYYYHWTRDSALTMNTLVTVFQRSSGAERDRWRNHILQYARFSRDTQTASAGMRMGEAKFYVDGKVYDKPWCNPQSDGPALRAVALIRFAHILLNQGEEQLVRSFFYDSQIPSHSVIKADLEYISHHWRETTCDLWEEIYGDHFYTRMAQRRALMDGAIIANLLGDPGAASWYRLQARSLEGTLASFWNGEVVVPTLNRTGGLGSKTSGIDSSVVLAALHANRGDGYFNMVDSRLAQTFKKHMAVFHDLYPINQRPEIPGTAIGRYPEDVYDGRSNQGGNPWVLLTAAFARYCYWTALEHLNSGRRVEAENLIRQGDDLLKRIRYHANPDGSLSEQMDRKSGYMTSARDLTWSYVEFIEAVMARDELKRY